MAAKELEQLYGDCDNQQHHSATPVPGWPNSAYHLSRYPAHVNNVLDEWNCFVLDKLKDKPFLRPTLGTQLTKWVKRDG